jgi:NADH-quinone oxidoreductase subunit L
MVTAGVYLIARLHPLFERAPTAAAVGAIVGCVTLLIAATIGLTVTDLKRVIAYSTMSQIGYMIMGVSSAAYAAGMFHLMTHAFFKALLFMAAGSVISAMGGIQDLDRMSGFRRAMPFTFGCMIVGGLALSGFPPFSGFFSKDEIIALEFDRGGWHIVLGVLGYVGSFLTAIYTFRMIFRAFYGDASDEARELEHGHLYHAPEPVNPATGEVEDTDVGFPGPEHWIAERALPMRLAMGALAILAIVGGVLQIPSVTNALHNFLEPTFRDSRLYADLEPSAAASWLGLAVGAAIAVAGIALAWRLWGDGRLPVHVRTRFAALHRFFVNKWYFDEALDAVFVRPGAWLGRFAASTFERVVVSGALVGGSSGAIRALSAAVRGLQSGYLRYYAALLLVGLTGLSFYFLVSA